jgi:hypothetical protein
MEGLQVNHRPPKRRFASISESSLDALRAFYSQPVAWMAWAVTSGVLAYGGGAAMFWLHAEIRGELGPQINPWYHWLLDSSLAFVALTPMVFLILPAALVILHRIKLGSPAERAGLYVVLVGMLFALVTGPGPFMHDEFVGRGKPLANLATRVFGRYVHGLPPHEMVHGLWSEMLLQVVVGIPVYAMLAGVGLLVVRGLQRRRRAQPPTPGGPASLAEEASSLS